MIRFSHSANSWMAIRKYRIAGEPKEWVKITVDLAKDLFDIGYQIQI